MCGGLLFRQVLGFAPFFVVFFAGFAGAGAPPP